MQDKGNLKKSTNGNKKYTIFLIVISIFIICLSVLGYTRWQQDLKKAKTYLTEKELQEKTNTSLTVELNALQQKIDSTSNFELLQQQSADLTTQIELLNQQITDLNTQKATLEKDITKSTSDLAALDKKIKTATTDYATKKAELDKLNTKIAKFAELKTAFAKYQTDSDKLDGYLNTVQEYVNKYISKLSGGSFSDAEIKDITDTLVPIIPKMIGSISSTRSDIAKVDALIAAIEANN